MVLNHLDVYNEESRMIIELATQVYRGILTEVRKRLLIERPCVRF